MKGGRVARVNPVNVYNDQNLVVESPTELGCRIMFLHDLWSVEGRKVNEISEWW